MRRSRKLTILAAMAGCVAFLPCQATGDNAETSLSRDVDNPALQPVRFRVQCSIPAASLGCNADAPVVPSGKRMVIEQVSVDAAADSGVSGLPRIILFARDTLDTVVEVSPQSTEATVINSTQIVFSYSRRVRAYFNPGEVLRGQLAVRGTGSSHNFLNLGQLTMFCQGFYVDLTLP